MIRYVDLTILIFIIIHLTCNFTNAPSGGKSECVISFIFNQINIRAGNFMEGASPNVFS